MLQIQKKNYKSYKNTRGRRLLGACLHALTVTLLVTVAVFFIMRLVPGDPAVMVLGEHADEAEILKLRTKLGLDDTLLKQFLRFLKNIALSLDTGESIKYGVSSRRLVAEHLPVTLALIAYSSLITVTVAVVLAVAAAAHRDGIIDHIIRVLPAFTAGMPVFWVGLMMILFFSVKLGLFPVGGTEDGIAGMLHSLTLPAAAVAFGQIPSLVRSLRERILEITDADFVLTLRAAGLEKRAVMKHILRNALVPTLMLFGVNLSYLTGGTLIAEKVFALNGIGKLLFEAISNRDFPLVQAIAFYCALFVVFISFMTKIAAEKLDHRQ